MIGIPNRSGEKMKTLLEVLIEQKKVGTALMAFNLQNLYQISAARKVSDDFNSPLIIQFSERYLRYLEQNYSIEYIINRFRGEYTYFHLDHCEDIDFIKRCVDWGFDSVMYDGSAKSIKENIRETIIVKEYAEFKGCLVEGELGKVAGVEDGFGSEGSSYAQSDEIDYYIEMTKIDMMALGIGNAHGFYQSLGDLNLTILKDAGIRHKSQLFVLHGGTGLPDTIVQEAISYGVVKINLSSLIKRRTAEIIHDYSIRNNNFDEISFQRELIEQLGVLFKTFIEKFSKK